MHQLISLVAYVYFNRKNIKENEQKASYEEYKTQRQRKRLTRTISISAIGIFLKCLTYIPRSAWSLDPLFARLKQS